jgi:hypothetical protein
MNATYQSIEELLQWFAVEPRTKRWDAMLAFDQSTVNTLLLQQYIERFNSDSYLPPVNTSIDLGNGSVAEIRNYVFDQPRLSFENANLDAPTATLRMQGLGGVRFNWNVSGSSRKLESISYEYPVNGDVHESVVKLTDKSASVRDHKVIIDVATGDKPLLKFGATLNEKKRAGEKVKSVFQIEPPSVREYVLSELKAEDGSMFKPEHLLLLTQPAPENRVRNSAQYGDGAVLVFVAFEGGNIGDRPYTGDPDWRYVLDPNAGGHSAILVISDEFIVGKLMKNALSVSRDPSAADMSGINFESIKIGNRTALEGKEGEVDCLWQLSPGQGWGASFTMGGDLGLISSSENSPLLLRHRGDALGLVWSAKGDVEAYVIYDGRKGPVVEILGELEVNVGVALRVELDSLESQVSVVLESDCTLVGEALFAEIKKHLDWTEQGRRNLEKMLGEQQGRSLGTELLSINATHLSNIVLAGNQPIRLKGAKLPGDLVMYGNITDERTGLVLNRQEVMVGAAATFNFQASGGGTSAVTWQLEVVDGTPANANDGGRITSTGQYTAPYITSTYVRVRLTATRGTYTTQALITVARELAAISPVVQLAVAGAGARYFVRGGAASAWEWDTTGLKGKLVTPVPEPGDEFEPGDMQYIPPATIDTDFIVENIKIKVGTNITSSTIVVTKGSTIDIAANLDASSMSATLTSSVSGTPIDVVYTKVAGAGALSGNVVTSEPSPAEPFIVIQAAFGPFMGYLLLPLPLSVLEGSQSLSILQNPSRTFDCSTPAGEREQATMIMHAGEHLVAEQASSQTSDIQEQLK